MTKLNEIELQSKTIDWLRFPLAVLVIFIHMNPDVAIQNANFHDLNLNSLYNVIGTLISKVVAQIAVPSFFMFSGFLFFNKLKEWNKTVYFAKVKTRIRTLIVPYILFNLSAVIIFTITKILKADGSIYPFLIDLLENWNRIFWNFSSWGSKTSNLIGIPMQPNFGPYVLPLWFLRDLIVMIFISPAIYYWVKYAKFLGLIVLFFFYYTKIWIEMPGYSSSLFLTGLFFFSTGAYFSINKKNIVIALRKCQIFWFIIFLITMLLSAYFKETAYDKFFLPLFILSGVITIVNIASFFMEQEKLQVNETLSKASFFIYCAHTILILGYIKKIIEVGFAKILGVDCMIGIFATYIITPFACVGVTLCIYLIVKRYTPSLLSLFTGNR